MEGALALGAVTCDISIGKSIWAWWQVSCSSRFSPPSSGSRYRRRRAIPALLDGVGASLQTICLRPTAP